MNWTSLTDPGQLKTILDASRDKYILIYKHSTRCGICHSVKDQMEAEWKAEDDHLMKVYYLDLLKYREISNEIEKQFDVRHQSPQVLLIKNGACIYHESQFSISRQKIMAAIAAQV